MGYEVERFVKQVDEHVICPLCKKVFKDPTNCTEGHTFCKVCIDQWLQTPENYKTCPKDQKVHVIDKQALSPNYALCGVINNLEVFCHIPHELKTVTSDPGAVQQTCDWTGKLQSLEKHRETCPFQQVKCPHVNCNEMMQRREREGHDKICKYKKVECEKCNKVFVRHVLQTHKDVECPEVLVPCPNGCTNPQGQNTEIKRGDAYNHLFNICAKTIVKCPFKDQGCSVRVERQDFDKHVQDNMAAHMKLLAKQCSSLSEQCSSLTEQCSSLTEENQALKNELKKVKAQLSSTNTYTWIIHDFPALCEKHPDGSYFTSPTFWLCGYKLSLEIYPNGFSKDVSGFISLYLNLGEEYPDTSKKVTKVPNSESTLQYRLSMISQNPYTQDVSFDETYVFKKPEGFGWPKFIERDKALSAAYCNSTNGSLTITCTILLDKP